MWPTHLYHWPVCIRLIVQNVTKCLPLPMCTLLIVQNVIKCISDLRKVCWPCRILSCAAENSLVRARLTEDAAERTPFKRKNSLVQAPSMEDGSTLTSKTGQDKPSGAVKRPIMRYVNAGNFILELENQQKITHARVIIFAVSLSRISACSADE